jgi:hypothetical protein
MTPVIINDNPRTARKLPSNSGKYQRVALTTDDEFERDWNHAISGNELVQRVHQHIEDLYARAEDCRYALTPEQFMLEMEQRIMKW